MDESQDGPGGSAQSPHLRGSVGAALWRLADGGVLILQPIFDTGSSVHFYVGDGEDALAVGPCDFAFIPVLIHSANECDPLSLHMNRTAIISIVKNVSFGQTNEVKYHYLEIPVLQNVSSHLPEGHFHHCVPVEVEAGDGLSVFQHLYRGTFLWLGFLCGGKELHKKDK